MVYHAVITFFGGILISLEAVYLSAAQQVEHNVSGHAKLTLKMKYFVARSLDWLRQEKTSAEIYHQ